MKPQTQRILNHLKDHGPITSNQALIVYGISRLSACIYDLRKEGFVIASERKQDAMKHRYTKYTLGQLTN